MLQTPQQVLSVSTHSLDSSQTVWVPLLLDELLVLLLDDELLELPPDPPVPSSKTAAVPPQAANRPSSPLTKTRERMRMIVLLDVAYLATRVPLAEQPPSA